MKTTYTIEPRVKKRWFKENEMYYDLVKETELDSIQSAKIGGVNISFFPQKEIKTVFTSKNIEEVLTIKNNLER